MKKIYLINPYGVLPNEDWAKYRVVYIAEELVKRGYDVLWITSTFRHRSKDYRLVGEQFFNEGKLIVHSIPCGGYERSISLRRVQFERLFMKNALKIVKSARDIRHVIMFEPSLIYGLSIYRHMSRAGINYSIDVLDLWPEIFRIFIPKRISFIFPILFTPFLEVRKRYMRNASVIIGASKDYIMPFTKLGRPYMVSYIGYDGGAVVNRSSTLSSMDNLPNDSIKFCYAGTFGANYDIESILIASARTSSLGISWVLVGDGEKFSLVEDYIQREDVRNIILIKKLPFDKLSAVYNGCDIGLAPYRSGSSVSMPLKFYDYVKFGLPIVTSLTGEVREIVQEEEIGLTYEAGSVDSLVAVVERIVADKSLLDKMNKNIVDVGPRYSSKYQHEMYVNFLEQNKLLSGS